MKNLSVENIDVLQVGENVVEVDINYPRNSPIDTIEIELFDMRAADALRVQYDYERDGWVMSQPRQYYVPLGDDSFDLEIEWIESAFCPAWKYELKDDEKEKYTPGNKPKQQE